MHAPTSVALAFIAVLAFDVAVFEALLNLGLDVAAAHIASFCAAIALASPFAARGALAVTPANPRAWYARFVAICLSMLFFRGSVVSAATDLWDLSPRAAIFAGVAAGVLVCSFGSAMYLSREAYLASARVRWRRIVLGMVAYAVALRLVSLGSVDLLPEEAYYWNYAQHLDHGYLDHPPMVAWLIWAGTRVIRDAELGVRIGAFCSWIIAASFCFALARNLYGKTTACVALLLCATLPFYFAVGMFMTPDAPLTAAWAGALYFLECALLRERRAAWWGVGICLGAGMLSKYTIALLGVAALVFIVLDPRSRRWLREPAAHGAALLAVLLFSPVILWNASHEWASFAFQGPQRVSAGMHFSLPSLVGFILLLLTPIGLAAVVISLAQHRKTLLVSSRRERDRRPLFAAVLTLVPLAVFVAFSLFHQVKLNWTGPLWLAVVPALAAAIVAGTRAHALNFIVRAWLPTVATMLVLYGAGLHYLTLGLPGVGYANPETLPPVAWREFGRQAALIEQQVESIVDDEPLRVGLDRYFLSSEMAFYDPVDRDGAFNTAGRHLFGQDSLMYNYWFPRDRQRGRTVILFTLHEDDLSSPSVTAQFSHLDPVQKQVLYKKGKHAGEFYYRVGYDYRAGL
jgi:dolichol-phosphate mannosyltransferase